MEQTNAIGTAYVNTPYERPAARVQDFERCTCISLTYTAFQEADGDGFVESIGEYKPRSPVKLL